MAIMAISRRTLSETLSYILIALLVLFVLDKMRFISQLPHPLEQYHISEKYSLNMDKYRKNLQLFKETHPIPTLHLPNMHLNGSKVKNWVHDHRPQLDHIFQEGLTYIHHLESSFSYNDNSNNNNSNNGNNDNKFAFAQRIQDRPSTLSSDTAYFHCPANLSSDSSCNEKYGWSYILGWFTKTKPTKIITGLSEVTCIRDEERESNAHTFCGAKNVMIDFSKMVRVGSTRIFSSGFVKTFGNRLEIDPQIDTPGHEHIHSLDKVGCEVIISEPTFILSNDDIYNLGHYMNDVMNIWTMIALSGRDSSKARLLNIDGFRRSGPAGGLPHRLMNASDPDSHGPYSDYFDSWFKSLDRASLFGRKKVCFKELYFPPAPLIPWFWHDWSKINQCSLEGSSHLYQSFHQFMKNSWNDKFGGPKISQTSSAAVAAATAISTRPSNNHQYHLVLETRSIDKTKINNNHSIARHIRNSFILTTILENIPNLKVTQVNFADTPFRDQVQLVRSADILVSMHGQGITHIFNMDIGRRNCCALIELQPDRTISFHNSFGFGNLARLLGLKYARLDADDGATTRAGTSVDVRKVATIVQETMASLDQASSCLLDVMDFRKPALQFPFMDI